MSSSEAWPTWSTSTAPASRSTSASWIDSCASTRAAAEHFWPANTNALATTAGTTSSRSASESTITAFLPPISATTRLRWRWPVGHLGGGADDLEPDLVGAGEGDRVHARVLDQRGADVALARQQRERVRRHARLAQRLDQQRRAARRLLGRLEDHRVAGGEPGGGHAERDRDREVPGRDDRDDAARRVAQLVALARHLEQGSALREVDAPRARSTRGSRSPRRRRRRPPATAWPPRGPRARRPRAAAAAASRRRRAGPRRARSAGVLRPRALLAPPAPARPRPRPASRRRPRPPRGRGSRGRWRSARRPRGARCPPTPARAPAAGRRAPSARRPAARGSAPAAARGSARS